MKPSTKMQYLRKLADFFQKESTDSFLSRCESQPKVVSVELKASIGAIYKQHERQAHQLKFALRSFLEFHESTVKPNGRLPVHRVRKKVALTVENAERIIGKLGEPYEWICRLYLHAGIDQNAFQQIQNNAEIHATIETQRKNDKPYLVIPLAARKQNLDSYSVVALKSFLDFPLPAKTRTGKIISSHDIEQRWKFASAKCGLAETGMGVHTLRSCFATECSRCGCSNSAVQSQMGHGSAGAGDQYGYVRISEETVFTELSKYFFAEKVASSDQVKQLEQRIKQLEDERNKAKESADHGWTQAKSHLEQKRDAEAAAEHYSDEVMRLEREGNVKKKTQTYFSEKEKSKPAKKKPAKKGGV